MNVGEWVFKRSISHPTRPFLKEAEREDRDFNNKEFNERTNRMAHAIMSLGLKKGDRVATLLINSSEFLEIFFACAKIGVIMVPINFRLATPELLYILGNCEPAALVYSSDYAEKVREIKAKNPGIQHFFKHGGGELDEDSSITGFAQSFSYNEPIVALEVTESDPLVIIYTSGTTGYPKGVKIPHRSFVFDAMHNILNFGVNRTFKSLVTAPLFHIGAIGASTTPVIYAGGSLVLKRFFNASEIIKIIVKEKINYMFAVPVMFQMMTEALEWKDADFSHVHYFISGGAPIPVSVIKKFQAEKGVGFAQGYGMTESLRISSLALDESIRKAGSVGKEEFHVLLRIIGNDGNDVPEGEVGEVIIKSPSNLLGYWNNPEETKKTLRNGWLYSGDMGKRDEEGFLYLVGRKSELIISAGENIFPAEVERVVNSLPEVKESAVVGIPDDKRGEAVAVFVLLKEGQSLTEEGLVDGLRGKVANFKLPKKVIFVSDFPRNTSGKILKRELKTQA